MVSTVPQLLSKDLAELTASVEGRRAELERSIAVTDRSVEALTRLRERMQAEASRGSGSFDRDDLAMVDEEISAHCAASKEMRRHLEAVQARQTAHAKIFKDMAATLTERSAVLEQENDVLEAHPRLLERLANKQLELESLLQQRVKAAAVQR